MTINETNFLDYLEQQNQQNQHCNHSLYLQWSNGSSAFESNLVPIGQIIQQDITIGSGSYWGFNAPICLSEYPYCECQILQGDPVNAQLAALQLVGRNFFIKKAPKIGKKH